MTNALLPLCFLLLASGAAGARGLQRALGARASWLGAGGIGLALALWLPGRALLPLTAGSGAWRVDEMAWSGTLWLLLLALATAVAAAGRGQARAAALAPALAAAGLLPLWAGTTSAWLTGLVILVIGWWLIARGPGTGGRWGALAALGLALPLLALGAALQSDAGPALAGLGATPWTALGAAALLGVIPFHAWRAGIDGSDGLAPLLAGGPALVGSAMLARLVAAGAPGPAATLWLTVLGLISLLGGLGLAWRRLDEAAAAIPRLAVAAAGLVLLSAAWAGPAAVLAEGRLLALAPAALMLLTEATPSPARRVVAGAAAAALAGLPLLVGFAARAALFDLWWADRRWALLAATALLQAPLAAGALLAGGFWEARGEGAPFPRSEWAGLAGMALILLGLPGIGGLVGASPAAWALTVIPALLALGLARQAGSAAELAPMVRQGLASGRLIAWQQASVGWWRGALAATLTALREAATILESEGGMLWLLLFLVLFWLARQ